MTTVLASLVMASRTRQSLDEDRALVARYAQARLRVELREHGSGAQLARKLGFTSAALTKAKNEGQVGADLATALAGHWGVTHDQLVTMARSWEQRGELMDEAALSPPAPPASETRTITTDDAIEAAEAIVDSVYDPAVHQPRDWRLAVAALAQVAPLAKANVEESVLARRFLDSAARAREHQRKVTPEELPYLTIGQVDRELTEAEKKLEAMKAESEKWAAVNGVKLRAEGDLHPVLKQAIERDEKRAAKGPRKGR